MTETSIHQLSTFLGKRTKAGIVVKEVKCGTQIGCWFIRVVNGQLTGDPKRMVDGEFKSCMGPTEIERVTFYANRAYSEGLI